MPAPALSNRDYAIITTLGPATASSELWVGLLDSGAAAFRLNTSHMSVDELLAWMERLEQFFQTRGAPVEVIVDLQGSKWRLGQLQPRHLSVDEKVTLILAETVGPINADLPAVLPVPRADFFHAAQISDGEVVLNDAKVRLRIEREEAGALHARVTQAGPISARKGLTLPGSSYRSEALSEKDHQIVERTRRFTFTSYAISYVKDAAEMRRYRVIFDALPGQPSKLIAKLERAQAMREAAAIAAALAEGHSTHPGELWVCRGDLGAEMGLSAMAVAVQHLMQSCTALPIPLIMAGQVLEHMTCAPNPTRSEVCYMHDCLSQGCRGFVLSDETAVGPYPLESCRAAAMFLHAGDPLSFMQ